MDNLEKLATQDTQDEENQIKPQHNKLCVGHHYTQTNMNHVNKI